MLKTMKTVVRKPKEVTPNLGTIRDLKPIHVAQELSFGFGDDVVIYDVRERTPFVSFYIVATAANDKRLKALTATGEQALYDSFEDVDHVEGRNDSQWILIDAHDIVLQLFTKEERKRVDLDSLYRNCPHKTVVQESKPVYRKRKAPATQENKA
jgi:ribosome-associated protein